LKERWRGEEKWWVEEEEDISSYGMNLRKRGDLEFERGRTRSHCMENWLWNGLWTLSKAG